VRILFWLSQFTLEKCRCLDTHPAIARYDGKGSMNDAGSWVASKPTSTRADTFDWLGSSFFRGHYEKWCSGSARHSCLKTRNSDDGSGYVAVFSAKGEQL
jgi:feruloyl esterase